MRAKLAVFASGGGTNLQALIDAFATGGAAELVLVVSDRAGSGALDRARRAGITTAHVPVGGREAGDVGAETLGLLQTHGVALVALAGYLRLVPSSVVAAYRDRMLNIHPALLPSFGGPGMYGAHVHAAVIAAGCRVSGATVHFVEERYDEGRILVQWPVPVYRSDTADTLAARVLAIEHRLYPAAVAVVARDVAATMKEVQSDAAVVCGSADAAASAERSAAAAVANQIFRLRPSVDSIEDEILALAEL